MKKGKVKYNARERKRTLFQIGLWEPSREVFAKKFASQKSIKTMVGQRRSVKCWLLKVLSFIHIPLPLNISKSSHLICSCPTCPIAFSKKVLLKTSSSNNIIARPKKLCPFYFWLSLLYFYMKRKVFKNRCVHNLGRLKKVKRRILTQALNSFYGQALLIVFICITCLQVLILTWSSQSTLSFT